jgi:Rod binding domain-containing protein
LNKERLVEGMGMQTIATAAAAVGSPGVTTPQPRLVRAAHEFEAQMMKELIKPLNQSDALTGTESDNDDDSGSNGALGEFASEALGRALSEGGGFGIASSIVKQLTPKSNHNGTVPVTGELHRNTVIKALK